VLRHGLDLSVKARLVARGLVAVNLILAGHTVYDRYSILEGILGVRDVASRNGLLDFLDMRTHQRALRNVTLAMVGSLAGTFTGLGSVCHGQLLKKLVIEMSSGARLSVFRTRSSTANVEWCVREQASDTI
jgi:hypothetical protein